MSKTRINDSIPLRLDTVDRDRIQQAIHKGWSRRDVMKMIGAGGVAAAAASQTFSAEQAAIAQTPKKGGLTRAAMNLHGPLLTLTTAW